LCVKDGGSGGGGGGGGHAQKCIFLNVLIPENGVFVS